MLNLNGSLTKAGVRYSTLWSEDFTDDVLRERACANGCEEGRSPTITSHVRPLHESASCRVPTEQAGAKFAGRIPPADKAIMGIFDEGCMGMYNAIIPDELLHPTGVFKERLSQSALVCRDAHRHRRRSARASASGCDAKGMKFHWDR